MMLSAQTKELDAARDFFTFWTSKWAALEYAKSGSNRAEDRPRSRGPCVGQVPGEVRKDAAEHKVLLDGHCSIQ